MLNHPEDRWILFTSQNCFPCSSSSYITFLGSFLSDWHQFLLLFMVRLLWPCNNSVWKYYDMYHDQSTQFIIMFEPSWAFDGPLFHHARCRDCLRCPPHLLSSLGYAPSPQHSNGGYREGDEFLSLCHISQSMRVFPHLILILFIRLVHLLWTSCHLRIQKQDTL